MDHRTMLWIGNSAIADAVAVLKNAFKNEPHTCPADECRYLS